MSADARQSEPQNPPDPAALTSSDEAIFVELGEEVLAADCEFEEAHIAARISPFGHPISGRDIALNDLLRFPADRTNYIAEHLLPLLLAHEKRGRRRSPDNQSRLELLVSMVLANALSAAAMMPAKAVHYSRKYSDYSDDTAQLYHPGLDGGAKALLRLIDLLEKGGWLVTSLGNRKDADHEGRRSTFRATEKLISTCLAVGINNHQTCRDLALAPVLVLKDADHKQVPYNVKEHGEQAERVRQYNRYIGRQRTGLNVSGEEWSKLVAELGYMPDLSSTALYRVFSNSDWRQHGRFYGGWWEPLPGRWRERITINGEETIERDFSGFMPRAVYHAEGLDFRDDPYDIPALREQAEREGRDWETVRDRIKKPTVSLICAGPEYFHPMAEIIASHHAAIAHRFRCGEGLRIMFRESQICQKILTQGVRDDIPVLPVHDSYIVRRRDEEWLTEQMIAAYRREFGFDPVLKPAKGRELREEVVGSLLSINGTELDNISYGETVTGPATVTEASEPTACPADISHAYISHATPSDQVPRRESRVVVGGDLRFQALLDHFRSGQLG